MHVPQRRTQNNANESIGAPLTKDVSDFVRLMADTDRQGGAACGSAARIKSLPRVRQSCSLTKTQRGLVTLSA
jgi:hypothetical protein